MADISNDIQQIQQADYGAQVRDSIVDALQKMNTETENASKTAADAAKKSAEVVTDKDGKVVGKVMEGADDSNDGKEGLVPKPVAGDNEKFLRGDGVWAIIDIGKLSGDVFEANKNGLVPGPPDASSNKFLGADGGWHELQNGSISEDPEYGNPEEDVSNDPQEPIKFFNAKVAESYNNETGDPTKIVKIWFDFQRSHYTGTNGKDYPIEAVDICRRTDGYVTSKNFDADDTVRTLTINVKWTIDTDEDGKKTYSSHPIESSRDALHQYKSVPYNDNENIEVGKTYYYSIVLKLWSPVKQAKTYHYNHQHNHTRVKIFDDILERSWSNVDLDTAVNMIQQAQKGALDLTKYWHDGDSKILYLDSKDAQLLDNVSQQHIELLLTDNITVRFKDNRISTYAILFIFMNGATLRFGKRDANTNWANSYVRPKLNNFVQSNNAGEVSKFLSRIAKPFKNIYKIYEGAEYASQIIDYASLLSLSEADGISSQKCLKTIYSFYTTSAIMAKNVYDKNADTITTYNVTRISNTDSTTQTYKVTNVYRSDFYPSRNYELLFYIPI